VGSAKAHALLAPFFQVVILGETEGFDPNEPKVMSTLDTTDNEWEIHVNYSNSKREWMQWSIFV
jgi:hypothetical protein